MCTFPKRTLSDRMSLICGTNYMMSPWLAKGLSAILEYPSVYGIRRYFTVFVVRPLSSLSLSLSVSLSLSLSLTSFYLLIVGVEGLFLLWIIIGTTPLDEWSARCRDLYQKKTQHSQKTDIRAPGGIRTRSPSKRAAADTCLKPHGRWNWPKPWLIHINDRFQTSAAL